MSRLAFCTLSSLATRKRSRTSSSSRYQAHLSYVRPRSASLLSSSRSSCILLVLTSGLLARQCQRWLTAAAGFVAGVGAGFAAGDVAGIARFYVFVFMLVDGTKQLAYTDGTTAAQGQDKFCLGWLVPYRPLAVCAGRPLACVSPTCLFAGADSNNPARSSARLPQACCSARTAVRRTEGQRALSGAISTRDRPALPAAKRPPGRPQRSCAPRAHPLEAALYAADAPVHPG